MANNKISQNKINQRSKKNNRSNNIYKWFLYTVCILMTVIILVSIFTVYRNGVKILTNHNLSFSDWFFGLNYDPSGNEPHVCGLVMIFNTLWMSFLAICIAAPIGIGTALIITRTLKGKSAALLYSVVAILAAVPSVIYGALGYYILDKFGNAMGFGHASLFTIVIMIAFMITPTITIMTIASIRLTDSRMEDSSLALGASKTQTSIYITIKAAKTGILTGIIFALGRSIAETTAISMVGSPSSSVNALTIVWWKQSLFLGPAILTANSSEVGGEWPVVPVISMLMITTTLTVFAVMKLIEYKGDENNIIKKQSNEFINEKNALDKYSKTGIGSLSKNEQKILINIDKRKENLIRYENNLNTPIKSSQNILQRSSISSDWKYENYKKGKTLKHNLLIYISASIGVILLMMIMAYLLIGGFEWLRWDYLTNRGRSVIVIDGHKYDVIGLSVPILGTYFSMILSVLIAAPLGIVIGISLATYLSKEKKLGWLVSYIFQALTAIPGVVWATFATTFLMSTGLYKEHIGFVPIIFMIFIILPSVIKSVEEAGGRVKRNLKDGSYALGASTATTTRRIYIKEVFPSIVSGVLLAMSIAMAESTIFIYIISITSTPDDVNSWFSNGGYTLSTLIYTLKSRSITSYPESAQQIKTVGIILMLIILSISYTSTLVNRRKFLEASFFILAIIMFPLALYINEGSIILVIVTILIALFAIFVAPIISESKKKKYADIVKSRGLNYGK